MAAPITPEKTRSIAIIAHGGAGKTTLIETLLFQAHAIASRGRASKGTAVMQTEPEEVEHRIAITPHVGHFFANDHAVFIVDTPGYFNFLESTRGVLPGVDAALALFSAIEGVKPETDRLWSMLDEAKLPTLGFINRIDEEHADFMNALALIQKSISVPAIPISIPIRAGKNMVGIVDIVCLKAWATKDGHSNPIEIPPEMQGDVNTLRMKLIEVVAENNDALLEKYLDGKELTEDEIQIGLRDAVMKRAFLPLLCGSATENIGLDALIEAIIRYLPSPIEREKTRPLVGANPADPTQEVTRTCSVDAPFSAITLKTAIDPFSGKLSVVRVFSGKVVSNQPIFNSSQNARQKIGHTYLLQGKELVPVECLQAGEIGAFSKLDETHTGDTLCDLDEQIAYPIVKFASPPVTYAIEADGKSEEKVGTGLNKLVDEDPTLHIHRDEQTNEMLVSGMGQTHIEIALERLTRKFGGKAKLKTPRVPYRETIKRTVKAQGKLKKQTGGHGQFANCWLEVGPLPRDGGFQFADLIAGGVIPRQFIPSIKKGVQDAMAKGHLAGFPVVDVKVSVYDGSYHDVDSSDYAFQVAGSLGFKAAVEQAAPVLLEPIMMVDIVVPEECTGDVLKDLSSRRGRVVSLSTDSGKQEIEAEAPMSEMLEYGNMLGAITSGRGTYTMSIASYRELPSNLMDKVLDQQKKMDAANG